MRIAIGLVRAVYAASKSVDVLGFDGARYSNVQVTSLDASNDTGSFSVPDVGLPQDETRWDYDKEPEREIRAVVVVLPTGGAICIGFLSPQVDNTSFDRKNFRVTRHGSGVYTTVSHDGDVEVGHPSGTFLRIGVNAAKENLDGADVDGNWGAGPNADKQPTVRIQVANAGGVQSTLTMDKDGKVVVESTGETAFTATKFKFNGPSEFAGNVDVTGAITATVDVQAAGVSLVTHPHTSASPGSPTSPPIPS